MAALTPFSLAFASVTEPLSVVSEESVSSSAAHHTPLPRRSLEGILAERSACVAEQDDDVRDCLRIVRVVERYRQSLAASAVLARRIDDQRLACAQLVVDVEALAEHLRRFTAKCVSLGCNPDTVVDHLNELSHAIKAAAERAATSVRDRLSADIARHESDMRKHDDIAACIREALEEGYKIFARSSLDRATPPSVACPVCFERSVEKCFTACGHTICAECESRMGSSTRCPMCRTPSHTVQLFLLANED